MINSEAWVRSMNNRTKADCYTNLTTSDQSTHLELHQNLMITNQL